MKWCIGDWTSPTKGGISYDGHMQRVSHTQSVIGDNFSPNYVKVVTQQEVIVNVDGAVG